jgi:hypothetical protein
MRALKALVIGMGVLLIAGVVTLVVVIAGRIAAKSPASPPAAAVPRGFGQAAVEIPEGAWVVSTSAVGDRLVVHLSLLDGTPRLLVLDPGTGRVLGTIDFRPKP